MQSKESLRSYINIKVDFRMRNSIRGKEEYFILIKGSIHQEYIILSEHASNHKCSKYLKQKLTN